MITAVEELIRCREIAMECMDDLRQQNIPFVESIPIGIMIEVPSALINADRLSAYSDFFSVGTNDLIQYTLAVDRISEKIAYLYNPMNLSILRLLRDIVKTSREHNTPLSICGEMAGEPRYIMPLIGLGFTDFSMSSAYIQQIKRIIRSVTRSECEDLVARFLEMEKTEDIESLLLNVLREKFSWLTL
jgi:phosphotransferase system enzyme I (PtsI)